MTRISAQATTGVTGERLCYGIDRSNCVPMDVGEPIRYWDREVTYNGDDTLYNVLTLDKYIKYDLLANILYNDEKISEHTIVSLYSSGMVKEIRIGKRRYRIHGKKYLGKK